MNFVDSIRLPLFGSAGRRWLHQSGLGTCACCWWSLLRCCYLRPIVLRAGGCEGKWIGGGMSCRRRLRRTAVRCCAARLAS
eukprot:scaffold156983_cov20-Cyclotella_meneghiniana.AAC.1